MHNQKKERNNHRKTYGNQNVAVSMDEWELVHWSFEFRPVAYRGGGRGGDSPVERHDRWGAAKKGKKVEKTSLVKKRKRKESWKKHKKKTKYVGDIRVITVKLKW